MEILGARRQTIKHGKSRSIWQLAASLLQIIDRDVERVSCSFKWSAAPLSTSAHLKIDVESLNGEGRNAREVLTPSDRLLLCHSNWLGNRAPTHCSESPAPICVTNQPTRNALATHCHHWIEPE